ncbi:GGDEF domain-containing protein [Saccharopolyspora hirsuta]|uniref:GGDEF domain-containing protein n=1 Tax=Saccharopolyspora hirsuta TaxID=1837 RepID=A0A5M7BLY8_SACHI|nr:GGDEF domain-containing protein [Saccharopolyspora hirsuta]KAA5829148.1 GGDEF domain-containing protein [Saccharopolyspora hirsuta]
MTGLRNGFAGPEPLREDGAPVLPPGRRTRQDLANGTGMADLHESIASLLASRGQWRQAYHHLRSALDLRSSVDVPRVPEQLRHEVNRLRREHAEAREQSMRDSLTASYNRRYLDERLADLLTEHAGSDAGLAVALVDLDWFKQVNDTYGHLIGDRVLQRVVDLLQKALPSGAFCARYGGEEFVLVLPDVEPAAAVAVCETARSSVERFPWSQMAPGLRVTVSVGVAHEHTAAGPAPISAEQQLISADALLYAAKQAGRNAVAHRIGSDVRLAGIAAERRGTHPREAAGY